MTYCQSRIALLLALPPLICAAFGLGGVWNDVVRRSTGWAFQDTMQAAAIAATLFFCIAWWAVWRPMLHGNARQWAATLAIAAVIIGQVLFWQPMWHSSGCADDDILRCAQSLTDLGLGCLGFALTWWGGRRWRQIRQLSIPSGIAHQKGRHDMSPNTVRLAVGFALMPLLPGVFFIVGQAADNHFSLTSEEAFVIAYAAAALIVVSVWWLVWRRAVVWTPVRRIRTGLLAALVAIAPFAPIVPRTDIEWIDAIVVMTPLMILGIWFAGTARVWRLAPGEMPAGQRGTLAMLSADGIGPDAPITVPCGKCDYDLRGLREARCPECGWTTTLDDLVRRGVAGCLASGD